MVTISTRSVVAQGAMKGKSMEGIDRDEEIVGAGRKKSLAIKLICILAGAVLVAGITVGTLYFRTSKRLDRTMRPFTAVRVALIRGAKAVLESRNIRETELLMWVKGQINLQSMVACGTELNPESPLAPGEKERDQIRDAIVRGYERASRLCGYPSDDKNWGTVPWWKLTTVKGSVHPEDWEAMNSKLQEILSEQEYEALVAAQEKYALREFFCK